MKKIGQMIEKSLYFTQRLSRYFEKLKIGAHLSYRFFKDDHQISGHTFDLEANRRIGEQWVISPHYRFYHQNQASFYSPQILKYETYMDSPDQSNGPFYSADHRLSLFDSHS